MEFTGSGGKLSEGTAIREDGQVPELPVSQPSVRPRAKQDQFPLTG